MLKKGETHSVIIFAIVAIVAVVGIVILFSQNNGAPFEDVVGEATNYQYSPYDSSGGSYSSGGGGSMSCTLPATYIKPAKSEVLGTRCTLISSKLDQAKSTSYKCGADLKIDGGKDKSGNTMYRYYTDYGGGYNGLAKCGPTPAYTPYTTEITMLAPCKEQTCTPNSNLYSTTLKNVDTNKVEFVCAGTEPSCNCILRYKDGNTIVTGAQAGTCSSGVSTGGTGERGKIGYSSELTVVYGGPGGRVMEALDLKINELCAYKDMAECESWKKYYEGKTDAEGKDVGAGKINQEGINEGKIFVINKKCKEKGGNVDYCIKSSKAKYIDNSAYNTLPVRFSCYKDCCKVKEGEKTNCDIKST